MSSFWDWLAARLYPRFVERLMPLVEVHLRLVPAHPEDPVVLKGSLRAPGNAAGTAVNRNLRLEGRAVHLAHPDEALWSGEWRPVLFSASVVSIPDHAADDIQHAGEDDVA